MSLKTDKILTKINNFFVANWWLNGISNIIIIIIFLLFYFELSRVEKSFEAKLNRAMQNTIVTTLDGRVSLINRHFVNTDSDTFRNTIAILAKNMTSSESELTKGFDKTTAAQITSPSKLLQVSENFALLHKEYFFTDTITLSFLRYYYTKLKLGQLAKKSSILSTEYEYSPREQGKFSIKIIFHTSKDFINKSNNKTIEILADDVFVIDGFIDPSKYSTAINPYGIKITNIKINLYTYEDVMKGKHAF